MKIDIGGTDCVCLKSLLNREGKPCFVLLEWNKLRKKSIKCDMDTLVVLGFGRVLPDRWFSSFLVRNVHEVLWSLNATLGENGLLKLLFNFRSSKIDSQ